MYHSLQKSFFEQYQIQFMAHLGRYFKFIWIFILLKQLKWHRLFSVIQLIDLTHWLKNLQISFELLQIQILLKLISLDIIFKLIIWFLKMLCNRWNLYQDFQSLNSFLFSKDNIHMHLILDISSNKALVILKHFKHISIFS